LLPAGESAHDETAFGAIRPDSTLLHEVCRIFGPLRSRRKSRCLCRSTPAAPLLADHLAGRREKVQLNGNTLSIKACHFHARTPTQSALLTVQISPTRHRFAQFRDLNYLACSSRSPARLAFADGDSRRRKRQPVYRDVVYSINASFAWSFIVSNFSTSLLLAIGFGFRWSKHYYEGF